jgi:hypothetical protein
VILVLVRKAMDSVDRGSPLRWERHCLMNRVTCPRYKTFGCGRGPPTKGRLWIIAGTHGAAQGTNMALRGSSIVDGGLVSCRMPRMQRSYFARWPFGTGRRR